MLILVLIIIIKLVTADYTTPGHVYDFETDPSSTNLEDQVGSIDSDGDSATRVSGINGYSWQLSTGYVEFTGTPLMKGNSSACISLWINDTTRSIDGMMWFAFNDGVDDHQSGLMYYSSTNFNFRISTTGGTEKSVSTDSSNVGLDDWYHIVWTYDGSNLYAYVNGTYKAVRTGLSGTILNNNFFSLGSHASAARGAQTNGNIDELYIYPDYNCTASDAASLSIGDSSSFYPFSAADTVPPLVSSPICTSCITGTNDTEDSTPTVNVTVTDDTGVQMVWIGNSSGLTAANAGSGRECTAGAGSVWVCTLPTSDKLSAINIPQPVYWVANDTGGYGHTVYNFTMNVTLIAENPPGFSVITENSSTSTSNRTDIQINITLTDNTSVDFYTLTHNDTNDGSFTNETIVDSDGTSVSVVWNYSIINFPIMGGTLGVRFWANDTIGNSNVSDIKVITVYTIPMIKGVTKDDNGVIVPNSLVFIMKNNTGDTVYRNMTSDLNGNYNFTYIDWHSCYLLCGDPLNNTLNAKCSRCINVT